MTREDFIENVTYWSELLNFCSDEDCDVCWDILNEEERDNEVDSDLSDAIDVYSWQEISDFLSGVTTGYDYYRRDGMFDYCGMTDENDFNEYKSRVLEWMDDGNYWPDEPEEGNDDFIADNQDDEAAEEDFDFEEEDFSVCDLLDMCSVTLIEIQRNTLREQKEDDMAFQSFIDANIPKILR